MIAKKPAPDLSGAGFLDLIASARLAGPATTRGLVYSLIVRTTLEVGR
jgi:hypothetical protein